MDCAGVRTPRIFSPLRAQMERLGCGTSSMGPVSLCFAATKELDVCSLFNGASSMNLLSSVVAMTIQ